MEQCKQNIISTDFSMTMYISKTLNWLYCFSLIKNITYHSVIDGGLNNLSNNDYYDLKGKIGEIKMNITMITQ